MATVTNIPADITTLKANVSTLQQDINAKPSSSDVDNKLKTYMKKSELSSELEGGTHAGNFYPLTAQEAVYFFRLGTTTAGANLYLNPDAGVSSVLRSTSSERYKRSVETVMDEYADRMFDMRPVWYRSICENDRKD